MFRRIQTFLVSRRPRMLALSLTLAIVVTPVAAGADLDPRPVPVKPVHTEVLGPYHETGVISVKFQNGLPIRSRNGELSDGGTGALDEIREVLVSLNGATWERPYSATEKRLQELRANGELTLGRELADLNVHFHCTLAGNVTASTAIDALNALGRVELAAPIPRPAAPPQGNLGADQGYLYPGPVGLNSSGCLESLGSNGSGVNLLDFEFSFNGNHQDLPSITTIGPAGADPFNDDNHGTAVFGIIGALDDGFGVRGMAPGAQLYFASSTNAAAQYAFPANLTNILAGGTLQPGDVILIEQQLSTPNGILPVEIDQASFDAIQLAVGNAMVVVEPAGNGNLDFDNPIFAGAPFNVADSGAIFVGSGHAPPPFGSTDADRSRFTGPSGTGSNYGSRVDVQGWGQNIYTTGYGSQYSTGGANLFYTNNFGGTSGGSAMVAGACVLIQSAYEAATSSDLTSQQMRGTLIASGAPQQGGTTGNPVTQNIGPRPDAAFAILAEIGGCMPLWDTSVGDPANGPTTGLITSLTQYDDGAGNALYAAGHFNSVGGVSANLIARWDGAGWSALGSGLSGGGMFQFVQTLAVFDDGGGDALYAGGVFDTAGGSAANVVACWDGNSWSALGSGIIGSSARVDALAVYNDGGGDALYVGGAFSTAGGTAVNNIAKWDGSSWSALGSGITGPGGASSNPGVYAMTVFDDGNGDALYVAGNFGEAGGTNGVNSVAKWDGTSWSAVGAPPGSHSVRCLEVYDDGTGDALYSGRHGPGLQRVHIYDGQQWSPLLLGPLGDVFDLAVYDDGTGPALYMGGTFEESFDVWTKYVAKWDGADTWPLGDGLGIGGPTGYCDALGVFQNGTDSSLYVAGTFQVLYDLPADNIARWGGCVTCPDADGNGQCDPPAALFIRGDATGDGIVNALSDALEILNFGFLGGPPPPCMEAADVDGNSVFNALADGLYMLTFGFLAGPPPPAPYPACGLDPAPGTSLGCASPDPVCNP